MTLTHKQLYEVDMVVSIYKAYARVAHDRISNVFTVDWTDKVNELIR